MGIFKDIKDGWGNYLNAFSNYDNLPEDVKDLAEKRAAICKTCPNLVESGTFTFIEKLMPGGAKHKVRAAFNPKEHKKDDAVTGYKCNQCGCQFPAMVFAKAKECPAKKW